MMNTMVSPILLRAPLARAAYSSSAELVDLRELGLFSTILGAEQGYNTEGDLVHQTADGRDLNELWSEFQATLAIFNERRQRLVDILTFPVTDVIEDVPVFGSFNFEEASEFGVPKGVRTEVNYQSLGYDFKDYDLATRYTWRYLRDADARAVEALHQAILDADNRLVFKKVMSALFNNVTRKTDIRRQNYNVYPLYNGDATVPPAYGGTTFTSGHDHYFTSQRTATGGGVPAIIDSDDFMALYNAIAEHGYSRENGTTFVAIANKAEIRRIRAWRAGQGNGDTGTGNAPSAVAEYDFIPAANQPTFITPNAQGLVGEQPPTTWNGLPVVGSYGDILVAQEDYIPAGYVLMLGSGGEGNLQNPVGIREHANPAYRGLRLLPGDKNGYPLIDSFYSRSFGTGVRQRGGAAILQLTMAGDTTYDVPAAYAPTALG